ncbi:MAG: UvrD-helicase domain-containing protein, partial [Bergeyella zoohelcum]|nr:UvrD-helicase domain-containing protein [Bergeyella zoohelcum]
PYLIEAVDKTLNEVGENEEISKIFIDFINYKLEQEEKVNISNSLYSKAKNFINDIHYQKLKDNSEFNLEAYNNAKNQLEKEIKIHKQNGKAIAQEAINLIKDNGLEEDDFSQKSNGIAAFFRKYIDYDNGLRNFPFPGNEEKAMANFLKGTASKKTEVIEAVNSILDNLIEKRSKIIKNYIERSKKKKILDEILPLKINTEIQQKLNEIEEEKDLVLLSKFNILINENLKNEPSAFIYEKIGSKFQHFFFDEFQDTSKMQWDNILPLRDHTISSENSSFTMVGDPKQSIYRFRGGDSELMLNILNKKEKTPVEVSVENLEYNWRSAKNIVAFNNELYDFISKGLAPEHQSLFSDKAKQIPRKDNLGRVKVNLIDYGNNAEFYETLTEQMHRDIQQCLDNGFSFSDITILCRYAKEIKQLSKILGSLEVSILGEKKHIKTISEKGLTLNLSLTLKAVMEYLNWEIQPENKQFLVKALYYLNQLGRIEIKDFTEEVATILALENDDKIAEEIEKKYGLKLNQSHRHHLNLYNHIEYIVTELKTFIISRKIPR